jgi:hypothetical protein
MGAEARLEDLLDRVLRHGGVDLEHEAERDARDERGEVAKVADRTGVGGSHLGGRAEGHGQHRIHHSRREADLVERVEEHEVRGHLHVPRRSRDIHHRSRRVRAAGEGRELRRGGKDSVEVCTCGHEVHV